MKMLIARAMRLRLSGLSSTGHRPGQSALIGAFGMQNLAGLNGLNNARMMAQRFYYTRRGYGFNGWKRRGAAGRQRDRDRDREQQPVPEVWPHVPLIALRRSPLFPCFLDIVDVSNPSMVNLMRRKIQLNQPYVGAFLRKVDAGEQFVTSLDEIHHVGVFAQIQKVQDFGRKLRLVMVGHRRIRITGQLQPPKAPVRGRASGSRPAAVPLLVVAVENVQTLSYKQTDDLRALCQEIVKTMRDLSTMNLLYKESLLQLLHKNQRVLDNPIYLCDLSASMSVAEPKALQGVLEEVNVPKRLMLSLTMLKTELVLIRMQAKIESEVERRVEEQQMRIVLQLRLKIVKRELGLELGIDETGDAIAEKYRKRLDGKIVPKNIQTAFEDELNKLNFLESCSAESNVIRNYLDWLTSLPWGITSRDNLCVDNAGEILNQDHYGMEDVKRRILEFIAVSALRGSTQGRILCLHGPPGVGKTSIAKSIARALGRQYFRFSMGAVTDVAEIKGHRRTYVGAMPGKMIKCLAKTHTENPLVLIDEVDKIGKGCQGDPSSALLELFDGEQSTTFQDNYLDVPIDLSRVLFICTANATDGIPEALRDRMEMIEMSGYLAEEKVAIARHHLLPHALQDCGLTAGQLSLSEGALQRLIHGYCRESGVRHLQRQIEKIIRRVACLLVRKQGTSYPVDAHNLSTFLGKQTFSSDRMYEVTPPGVALALALAMGDSSLYIEASPRNRYKSGIQDTKSIATAGAGVELLYITGNLGAVMKESAQIALTVARNFMHKRDPGNQFLELENIHLHVPDGAVPKDDPSAGIAIITALMSLATSRPVRQDLAMTGEISLKGKVLPVAGIKEKVIAARRSGVHCIILPADNRKDFEELPMFIADGLEVHFAANYEDVHNIAFSEPTKNEDEPKVKQAEAQAQAQAQELE